jgi:ferredoxin
MRVQVDRDRCAGSGTCALTAPGVFDQDTGDGLVALITDHPAASDEQLVREAADLCPVAAIFIS